MDGVIPGQTDATSTTAPTANKEGESSKPATPGKKSATTKTKVKREEDDEFDLPDDLDVEDERIDLAELNFPGGPVSSSRKNDRSVRGWKKIELWIEQEDAEEIVLDDEPAPPPMPPPPAPKEVTVKVEEDEIRGVIMPIPEPMPLDEVVERKEEVPVVKPRVRRRRQKKSLKGKSREEKEELAREEVDQEVLKEQFLAEDGSDVFFFRDIVANLRSESKSCSYCSCLRNYRP